MRLLVPGALLAALAVTVSCSGSAPGDRNSTPSPSPSTAQGSTLTVMYDDGKGKSSTWQLSCDPAGGDHPDPPAACAALTKHATTALPAVSKDKICTEQFGGPQTAVLIGTWQGEPVDSRLSRTDGCEIARWDVLVGLLPRVAP